LALQIFRRISAYVFFVVLTNITITAQEMNTLKSGVVRIENSRQKAIGTGFIVKIDGSKVFVVTASHVVKGEQFPKIYLFSEQFESLSATVLNREDDADKGLALLLLKIDGQTSSKLTALSMVNTSDLGNGESVKIIGFPSGTSLWTVDNGYVKRLEGRDLVLSGTSREGNSGGPVILNEQVIGLVTDIDSSDAHATRAEFVVPYVNGIVKNLIAISDRPKPAKINLITNGGFEEDLRQWGTGYVEERMRSFDKVPRPPFWVSGGAEALGMLDSTEHHSGNQSFRITNKSTSVPYRYGNMSQRIGNLKPYSEYEVSLWVKARNASRLALVLIFDEKWYDRREVPAGSYEWTNFKFRFKTSTDPFADIRLFSENPGTVWVDDIEVYVVN
jgi:S1-C subfamily serine protease